MKASSDYMHFSRKSAREVEKSSIYPGCDPSISWNKMEAKHFETMLKPSLDLTKFSQLLEMDHEESRMTSSTALYEFIERAEKTVDDMKHAL